MRERVYPPVIRTALGLFRALDLQFTIEGVEHIPATGGAVLASNHVSYFDFMFVGLAAHQRDRLVRFMAKQSVFTNPVSGPLMRGMHHIPVDRSAGASAYSAAVRALRDGELVGVFPESTISRSFVPRTFKAGAARMALEAGAPLLPVVVWGGQRLWTTGRRPQLRRHVPVTIRVGPAIDPPAVGSDDAPAARVATAATATLRSVITEMTEAVQRAYPAPDGEAQAWWQPAYLGGTAPTPEEAEAAALASIAGRGRRRTGSA
ncbi:MAG TPA: lysophospholipid acyltransferase family protein [Mycobacteriales bacterium]|nr:lysophospholipid acyltransferase family protein [Mycobacteriales bacterium]